MAKVMEREVLAVTPVSFAMGARVEGIDLRESHDHATVEELRRLMREHHLLVLPNQHLSARELESFGRIWGDLLTHPASEHEDTRFVQLIGARARMLKFGPGFKGIRGGWHSDMTWHHTPPHITGLHAQRLPSRGGDTAFANQHLAYETLPEELREKIANLRAFHTGKVFGPDVEDSVHPVVRTHDETGRKALFVNTNFTRYILDVSEEESERLLYELFSHSSRPEFTYRHAWSLNDLVLWDNRSVMHYAVGDYDEIRIMHRIVVKGDVPK